jgi:hypothetical protein
VHVTGDLLQVRIFVVGQLGHLLALQLGDAPAD